MNRLTAEIAELELGARRIRLIGRLLSRVRDTQSTGRGLTRSEQAVLSLLEENGPLSAKRLAELEEVRPQSVAQTLESLERAGLVRRERSANDRREVFNMLTEAGVIALRHDRGIRQRWLVSAFQKTLSADEQAQLLSALELLEKVAKAGVES